MVYKIADNIVSPLGEGSKHNYQQIKAGKSALASYTPKGLQEGVFASLFSKEQLCNFSEENLTKFESLVVRSVKGALAGIAPSEKFDLSAKNVLFVLGTTKANVDLLSHDSKEGHILYPGECAKRISSHLGITTSPIVVCNACISGLSSIVLAAKMLEAGFYKYAIVCGADVLSKFILSGFQSLKTLSEEECRPFDLERYGMNLGEAAATIILSAEKKESSEWWISGGTVRNDAYNITAPSKEGEGAYLALKEALEVIVPAEETGSADAYSQKLALVNAHGTATMFMDQMESVALERTGLGKVPINSLKGYFGHTLGAAGVLETVLTMQSVDDGTVLKTRGFEELGVSGKIEICKENKKTDKKSFIKLVSGFGGANAALFASKEAPSEAAHSNITSAADVRSESTITSDPIDRCKIVSALRDNDLVIKHSVQISPKGIVLDGKTIYAGSISSTEGTPAENNGTTISRPAGCKEMLTQIYKSRIGDYPQYYKMDMLSRLGFIASELLLKEENKSEDGIDCWGANNCAEERERADATAVILFNHSSSLATDLHYLGTIAEENNYFPSPALFVYTLPNIVTGEIAIRNKFNGETSFYILNSRDEELMHQVQKASFLDRQTKRMITGWLDYTSENEFVADISIIDKMNKN